MGKSNKKSAKVVNNFQELDQQNTVQNNEEVKTSESNPSSDKEEAKPENNKSSETPVEGVNLSVPAPTSPAEDVKTILLNQKPIVTGNMSASDVQAFVSGTAESNDPVVENQDEIDIDSIADAIADAIISQKTASQVPVVAVPHATVEPQYVFDPHPAWKWGTAAAGLTAVAIIIGKCFGGK